MKAIYHKKQKCLIIENGMRGFGNVPMMGNFEQHPPINRYLNAPMMRDKSLQVEIIND